MNTQSTSLPGIATPKAWRHSTLVYAIVTACWLLYAALSLFAPAAANARFQLSDANLLLLRLTIIIPVHLIWLLAVRGAVRFKYYASVIKSGRDSPGIDKIANGLFWTLAYLIAVTLGGAILPFFREHPSYDALVVFRDHLTPLFALIAFALLYRGSQHLKTVASFPTWTKTTAVVTLGFIAFTMFFVYEFATAPAGLSPTRTSLQILSHEVMLFTYVVPYVLAWFVGLLAIINISSYAAQVKGVLYRRALQNLVRGIGAIIFFMVFYQILLFSIRFLLNLNVASTLLLVYTLLILYGLGFVFVNSGAGKLMKIEAVR